MMTQLTDHLRLWQSDDCPGDVLRYIVAFSGGLDSTALLHALHGVSNRPVLAVHVHHGLSAQADAWQTHCADLCRQWQVDFESLDVQINAKGEGLEAAARKARYSALQSFMQSGDALLTGHHQRDQAETLLLQLLRGSGVAGMAAMPAIQEFGPGWRLRPLLDQRVEALQAYAAEHGLTWVEDPSNDDAGLDRNYLRHRVMPVLRERWPAVDSLLARSAEHSASASQLLNELAREDLAACRKPDDAVLSVSALRGLNSERRSNLLRYWLRSHGYQPPSTAQLECIETDLLIEREDAQPVFAAGEYELRRYRDHLFLLQSLPAAPGDVQLAWNGQDELCLPPGCGRLRAQATPADAPGLPNGDFCVRFIQGGERIRPANNRYRRRLKQLFQEHAVPPWVRMRMPLIYHGQELVAVADAWLNADYLQSSGQTGWRPHWLDRPVGWPEETAAQA